MAKRKVKRRSRKKSGGGGDWRHNNALVLVIGLCIVGVWAFFLAEHIPGCRPSAPDISHTYISEVNGPITLFEDRPITPPPYVDEHTGEQTAWPAWTCTRPECIEENGGEPPVFPQVWEDPPEGVEMPDWLYAGEPRPGEDPAEAAERAPEPPEEMTQEMEEAMYEWEAYEEEQYNSIPECPICGEVDPQYVERYLTPEDRRAIEAWTESLK